MTAALDDADPARRLLTEALAVDPAFDPTQARRAAQTLERPRP